MAYAGCSVISGCGHGVVTAVGKNTEIGKIASSVLLGEETKTPLIIRMEKFTKKLGLLLPYLLLLIAIILYFKGYVAREIFFTSSCAFSISYSRRPSFYSTLSLSIASRRMAKRNVIVKG